MKNSIWLFLWLSFCLCTAAVAGQDLELSKQINTDLKDAATLADKATFTVYKARYYRNHIGLNKNDFALSCYTRALEYDDQPWIRLERSSLLLKMRQYDEAVQDANAAKRNTNLSKEANLIIAVAEGKLKDIGLLEQPATSLVDSAVNDAGGRAALTEISEVLSRPPVTLETAEELSLGKTDKGGKGFPLPGKRDSPPSAKNKSGKR